MGYVGGKKDEKTRGAGDASAGAATDFCLGDLLRIIACKQRQPTLLVCPLRKYDVSKLV